MNQEQTEKLEKRNSAYKNKLFKETERRRITRERSDVHVTVTCTLIDNAARMVKDKIAEMEKKNIRIGREAAIQMLLNEMYNKKYML